MSEETNIKWGVGVAAAVLAATGFLILRFEDPYSLVLSHAASCGSLLRVAGGSAIIAAGLLIFPQTRSLGILIAGGIAATSAIAAFLIQKRHPEPFNVTIDGQVASGPHSTQWLLIGVAVLSIIFCAGAIYYGLCLLSIRQRDMEDVRSAKKALEDTNAAAGKLDESRREAAKTQKEAIQAAHSSLELEKERLKKVLLHRPYESQLVAAFSISLAVMWQRKSADEPISFNHFQGNKDKDFGDFVGLTAGSCWLIELKRDWACVRAETRKHARLRQADALLQRRDGMRQLADSCHWLGWGESNVKQAILRFSPYWKTWRTDAPPAETRTNAKFVTDAFEGRIGAPPDVFAKYLRFLMESASPDEGDEDTIAALVFERDATGNVTYWIAPDLLSVGKDIEQRIALRQRQIERQREIDEENRRKLDPDNEIDPPGFSL